MPVMWTTLTYLVYTCCCLIYRQEGADFYVNALWNFASVLIPLVTIQSCISTNIGAFVEKKGPKGENYKLVNSSSRSLSISSKPTNIVYHAN
ncbi:hypothetical protein BC833DRAFT_611859 [Globomyces pollinis-pini]|nr:hypothetical protein BC833DRAFT_611859 [Globomyces pollinis-pini]